MKIKEAEKNRLESLIDTNCPPNHTVLSEADRLESLSIAQKSKYNISKLFFFFNVTPFQDIKISSMN